jgi:general secretion pathway protein F
VITVAMFHVRYVGSDGTVRDARVDAADGAQVHAALGVPRADVLRVEAQRSAPGEATSTATAIAPATPNRRFPLTQFCEELATLLESGLALHEALTALKDKEQHAAVAQPLAKLLAALDEGQSFGAALARQQQVFGEFLVATVEASQRTGQIPEALRRHAEHLRWRDGLRRRLVGAAMYPAMLLAAGLAVCGFLTVVVVPRFADLYDDIGSELPAVTRALLALGTTVSGHPVWSLAGALAAAFALVFAWRSGGLARAVARAVLRVPRARRLVEGLQFATLYRVLGLLLQSGVPVVQALHVSRAVLAMSQRPALEESARRVERGEKLSDALEAAGLCTPVSVRMVRVGERSGQLGAMLERAARFHDDELVRLTEWASKVVGPVLMLAIGALIGALVLVMYMPIFDVAGRIQ